MIAKSTIIKGRAGKSGGLAVKAVDPTSEGLGCVFAIGLRPSQSRNINFNSPALLGTLTRTDGIKHDVYTF